MRRSELNWARVNPRVLSRHAEKQLRENLRTVGLLGPAIVFNERLRELLSGHKRLEAIDKLERQLEYELDVTCVELDRDTHDAQLNFLNNPNAQGQYDYTALGNMFADRPQLAKASGFDRTDMAAMFPKDARFGGLFTPARPLPQVERDVRELDALRAQKKQAKANARERDALDFHVVLVAQDGAELQRLLALLGAEPDARYVDAARILRLIGDGNG